MSFLSINLQALVQRASWPVYGIIGHPHGLTIHNHYQQEIGPHKRLVSVGFSFTSPRETETYIDLTLYSANAREKELQQGLDFSARSSWTEPHIARDLDINLFRQYGFADQLHVYLNRLHKDEIPLLINGLPFLCEIRYWKRPYHLARFQLVSDTVILAGTAFGLPLEILLQLLRQTTILNQRNDILMQYQHDLQKSLERHFNETY